MVGHQYILFVGLTLGWFLILYCSVFFLYGVLKVMNTKYIDTNKGVMV